MCENLDSAFAYSLNFEMLVKDQQDGLVDNSTCCISLTLGLEAKE